MGVKDRKVFESPPSTGPHGTQRKDAPRQPRDSLSPVDAASAFASAAALRASRRSGGREYRRELASTSVSRGMSEPERGV